ncbi:hypothetical protein ACLOJK_011985 [Asimina triloba]
MTWSSEDGLIGDGELNDEINQYLGPNGGLQYVFNAILVKLMIEYVLEESRHINFHGQAGDPAGFPIETSNIVLQGLTGNLPDAHQLRHYDGELPLIAKPGFKKSINCLKSVMEPRVRDANYILPCSSRVAEKSRYLRSSEVVLRLWSKMDISGISNFSGTSRTYRCSAVNQVQKWRDSIGGLWGDEVGELVHGGLAGGGGVFQMDVWWGTLCLLGVEGVRVTIKMSERQKMLKEPHEGEKHPLRQELAPRL